MIHPDTELRYVNDHIGYGVFAKQFIPKGTLVYVKDKLEIELNQYQFNRMDDHHKQIVEKYSYIDQNGIRIISWDNAKYVNHKCDCNTMSSGYGFEIAIKDIEPGEEITDEYGLFNLEYEILVDCNCSACRVVLRPDDIENHFEVWDGKIIGALEHFRQVSQPLAHLLDRKTKAMLEGYLDGKQPYYSVINLRWLSGEEASAEVLTGSEVFV